MYCYGRPGRGARVQQVDDQSRLPHVDPRPTADAAADGSTLKAATPATVSPTGGMQVTDPLVLTASKATGKYADVAMSYQFQVRSGTTVVYDSGVVGGVGSGSNVTHTPTAQLDSETQLHLARPRGVPGRGGFVVIRRHLQEPRRRLHPRQ